MKHTFKIPAAFFTRDAVTVACELLGKIFVKMENKKRISGRIVETEAYTGEGDFASHSCGGKKKRNAPMFESGGILYVYLSYGVHYCCNIVTGNLGQGEAVLIRGIDPIDGIEVMAQRRFWTSEINGTRLRNITNGPGKVCQAFGITADLNGVLLDGNPVSVEDASMPENSEIVCTPRIGITKSTELLRRFVLKTGGGKYQQTTAVPR